MKKLYIFVLLGLLVADHLVAQNENEPAAKDSLKRLVKLSSSALRNYDYNKAIEYSLDLIKLAEEKQEYYHLYHGYNVLGASYTDLKDTVRAKESYEKALQSALVSRNDTILWWAYNNLGNVFSENEKTIEKGFQYYDKAIEIATKLEDPRNALTPIINKGWTHLDGDQYDRAYPYLLRARDLVQDSTSTSVRSQLSTLFGIYYSGKNNFGLSRSSFEEAISLAEKDSLILEASLAYDEFAEMLFKNGQFEEAYTALDKHLGLQGKIFEQEKLHQREAAYTRYETDEYRKNLEIAEREQEYKDEVISKSRQLSGIMIFSSITMLLFLIFQIRSNRTRKGLIAQLKEKNSELVKAKEEAERLSLLKSRFFSTVSHELRTPLYGVVGLTSLLLEDNKDSKQEEDLKSLKFSADYLLALINDVLQMNKMESKLVQLENTPFNIQDLIRSIVKSFEFSRHQNQNDIDVQIDKNIPLELIGDSVRLSQVLMNLVGNAIKFTERGKVWIKAEKIGCQNGKCRIYFEVGDTGIGIPENKQKEIFEEFSQLKANNYNYQGTGLGLPIVRKLLNLFGSSIKVESEEGKGSVFSFEIVFEEGKSMGMVTPLEGEAVVSGILTRTALIVDDNKINRVVTQRILEQRDFSCKTAGSGQEAIEILRNEHFDLVLMDVNMPGMNGMQTTREVRNFSNVPIIALTAVEIQEMRDEILASGMNDIIVKPYDVQQFFQKVFKNLLAPVA